MGVIMSSTRPVRFSTVVSSFSRLLGYSGVRLSNRTLSRAFSGVSKLMASTLMSAK